MSLRRTVPLCALALLLTGACTSGAHPAKSSVRTPAPLPTRSAHARPAAVLGGWQIAKRHRQDIEGYASSTTVLAGQPVSLYVSTTAARFAVSVFRMGWYGGKQSELVRTLRAIRGGVQPVPVARPPLWTVEAQWQPSVRLDTTGLAPGDYLLRLEASDGAESYVPLTVRERSARGTVVLVSPVTTWAAYNLWGCCDLYAGANGQFVTRSRIVSFDRPYLAEHGAGEFIARTLPVLSEAERLRLPLDYVTDVDLDADPHLLDGARAVVSMGHDEYWSPAMRAAVTTARDDGTNLAFFGANAMFRRIRFAATALGSHRLVVDYKLASQDPLLGHDDAAVTSDWSQPPDPEPESAVTGESYGCFGKGERAAAVVTDATSPLLAGTGLTAGAQLPTVMGPEVDRVAWNDPVPRPLDVLLHAHFHCPPGYPSGAADTTYYTTPSGAGVFDAGSESWVCAMTTGCTNAATAAAVTRITDNVLLLFAGGPAARTVPARDNVKTVEPAA